MNSVVESFLRVLGAEVSSLIRLSESIASAEGEEVIKVVDEVAKCSGRVILTGVGKSGIVARKIAATMASTGTPSFYMHAAEAGHGDLGMIAQNDIVIALSWSGSTAELQPICYYCNRHGVQLVGITAGGASLLAKCSNLLVLFPKVSEACPHNLAPTSSTTMFMAFGDALALTLLEKKGFTAEDFYRFHPGGKLGAQLKRLGEIVQPESSKYIISRKAQIRDALFFISECRVGCVMISDGDGRLTGLVTDGDIRRALSSGGSILARVETIMTENPSVLMSNLSCAEALALMNQRLMRVAPVVDVTGLIVGLVSIDDFLKFGVM